MAGEVARITVRCNSLAPVLVRRRLAQLRELGWLLGDALLVATELVTNAVRHSMCSEEDLLAVAIDREAGHIRISVHDPGNSGASARIVDKPGLFGGLGLRIVEQLATHWGSSRRPDGYEVWAELPLVGEDHLRAPHQDSARSAMRTASRSHSPGA
jgi:hypothetical protein